MTLRMEAVAAALPALLERHAETRLAAGAAVTEARAALGRWSDDPAAARARIEAALRGRAVPHALPLDEAGGDPAAVFPASALPPLTVVAVDGSSIAPDRFAAAGCYVINTGYARLSYDGSVETALGSDPETGLDRDLFAADGGGEMRRAPRGLAVNLLRDVRELERGADLAEPVCARGDAALLIDGTLLPWDLHARQASDAALEPYRERTLAALDRLRGCGEALAVGAYISASAAREVAVSLEALAPPPEGAPPVTDGDVFRGLLADGQRSALFRSRSSLPGRIEELLPGHEVAFFYLRAGDDVARVELPVWAASAERADRLHAALVDQCRRCDGYPRALQEAHEQAVISASDRAWFERLLERLAGEHGVRQRRNGKQRSKRVRAL